MSKTKQSYYLGQGPWLLIKDYLGVIKNKYSYSQFMELELEVIEKLWEKHSGVKLQPGAHIHHCPRPEPYTRQLYSWEKTKHPLKGYSNILLAGAIHHAYDQRGGARKVIHTPARPGWRCTPRHHEKEVSGLYYKKKYPAIAALAATIKKIHQEDEHLEPPPPPKVKNIHRLSSRKELEVEATMNATEQAVLAYDECVRLGKQQIFAACVNNPNRKMFYAALDQAVRLGKRKCLCGCIVATKTKAFDRHLKTNTHTKQLALKANIYAIEAWYQYSGVLPPGFERRKTNSSDLSCCSEEARLIDRWTHIIPADPGRVVSHPASHCHAFNMCHYISTSGWGTGKNRIEAIHGRVV
jgi:hypothetical protein